MEDGPVSIAVAELRARVIDYQKSHDTALVSRQVAQMLGLSWGTLLRRIRTGKLKADRISGIYFIRPEAVLALLDQIEESE